ncbi:hypothetical protein [Aquisphaera insulae]|uniref:hypothetical protein n=1 Tax=Aquisphaera insulae TaxID=2712864 RepID=UPI0013EDC672|nr:hypothetical protein [Aquisphaera insulae]
MARISDPKAPEAQVAIKDFGRFETNSDPHDVPPGTAVKQVDAASVRPGELRAKPGVKVVQFD